MKNKTLSLLSLSCLFSFGVEADSFQDFQNQFQQFKSQQAQGVQAMKDEFEEYKKELMEAFDNYKAATAKVWGKEKAIVPDKHNMVAYLGELNTRSVSDFATGNVLVEVAADSGTGRNDLQKQMRGAIKTAVLQSADKRSMVEMGKQPVSQIDNSEPVLLDMIDISGDGYIKSAASDSPLEAQLADFAREVSESLQISVVVGTDGKERIIATVSIDMLPDHLLKRAQRYVDEVKQYSNSMNLHPALVLSVMEVESSFNPVARSAIPAFGLMQLVPTTGARDAYRYIYKKDRIVDDTYLYHPANNIELGTALLRLYDKKYLARIENPTSRQWATIAAYNTGPGNVFHAFAGRYSSKHFVNRARWRAAAIREINKMTSEQVYEFMLKRLPYKETRRYLKKVRKGMEKYQA
jgi:membrane-bound lytic murein transglycosylase C